MHFRYTGIAIVSCTAGLWIVIHFCHVARYIAISIAKTSSTSTEGVMEAVGGGKAAERNALQCAFAPVNASG